MMAFDFEIYINGNLDAFTKFSGSILTTPISLMIGQVLPEIHNIILKVFWMILEFTIMLYHIIAFKTFMI